MREVLGPTVIACGSREGQRGDVVSDAMPQARALVRFHHMVVGSGSGTDLQCWHWAVRHELDATVMPARWRTGERKGAVEGPMRNVRMGRVWREFLALFAFPGSAGTENMVRVAHELGKPVYRLRDGLWMLEPSA